MENTGLLLNGPWDKQSNSWGRCFLCLNIYWLSLFLGLSRHQVSDSGRMKYYSWHREINEGVLKRENETMGMHKMYLIGLRELADVTTKLWCSKGHSDSNNANITPIFKKLKREDPVKERLPNVTSVLWGLRIKRLWETFPKAQRTRSCWKRAGRGFPGKSYLIRWLLSAVRRTGLINQEMSVCLTLARLLTPSTFWQPDYISNSVVSRELGFFSEEKRIWKGILLLSMSMVSMLSGLHLTHGYEDGARLPSGGAE